MIRLIYELIHELKYFSRGIKSFPQKGFSPKTTPLLLKTSGIGKLSPVISQATEFMGFWQNFMSKASSLDQRFELTM